MRLASFYKEFDRNVLTPPTLEPEWELLTEGFFLPDDMLWGIYYNKPFLHFGATVIIGGKEVLWFRGLNVINSSSQYLYGAWRKKEVAR